MKKFPSLHHVSLCLKRLSTQDNVNVYIDGMWLPARPMGLQSFISRIRLAWGVFTGKYDALQWPGGQ